MILPGIGAVAGLVGGAAPLVMPSYLDSGSVAMEDPPSGTFSVQYPATVAPGNFALLHVRCFKGSAPTVSTPSGWNVGAQVAVTSFQSDAWFWRVCDGSEDGATVNVTHDADQGVAGVIHRFSHGSGVEDVDNAVTTASSSSHPMVAVTTADALRLAVTLLCLQATAARTFTASTGETGGDWLERFDDDISLPTASLVWLFGVQTADMAIADTVTGGSFASSAACINRVRHAFAITP